jgi:hypothetical protein
MSDIVQTEGLPTFASHIADTFTQGIPGTNWRWLNASFFFRIAHTR